MRRSTWLFLLVVAAVVAEVSENPCMTTVCDASTCVAKPLCDETVSASDPCFSSVCRVVGGAGRCERAFDTFRCPPAAMPDKPFFRTEELPGSFRVMDNDVIFGQAAEFVAAAELQPAPGLSLSRDGVLTATLQLEPGIYRFRYRLCLKSGAWCSSFTDVTVFILGSVAAGGKAPAESKSFGMLRGSHSVRALPNQGPEQPTLTPVECKNNTVIGNQLCPSQFNEGCPYGYDDNWECLPAPTPLQCKDRWENLARLWANYFGERTTVNTFFDGLLRQEPCSTCTQGTRVV